MKFSKALKHHAAVSKCLNHEKLLGTDERTWNAVTPFLKGVPESVLGEDKSYETEVNIKWAPEKRAYGKIRVLLFAFPVFLLMHQ